MPYNFAADSFHTKKLCSRLSSSEVHFLIEIGRFAFLRPPLGYLSLSRWWRGLSHIVTTCLDQRTFARSCRVSTGMSDVLRAPFTSTPSCYLTSHSGQLSLTIYLYRWVVIRHAVCNKCHYHWLHSVSWC